MTLLEFVAGHFDYKRTSGFRIGLMGFVVGMDWPADQRGPFRLSVYAACEWGRYRCWSYALQKRNKPQHYEGRRFGDWLFHNGDLYRIIGWNYEYNNDRHDPILSNWSRPRIDFLRGLWRRIFGDAR